MANLPPLNPRGIIGHVDKNGNVYIDPMFRRYLDALKAQVDKNTADVAAGP